MDVQLLSKVLGIGSLVILIVGIVALLVRGSLRARLVPFCYLLVLLFTELFAWYMSDFHSARMNVFLLYFSGFIHFTGVTLIVNRYFNPKRSKYRLMLLPLGLLLLLQSLHAYEGFGNFQTYGNVLYNLLILSFSLSHFTRMILDGDKPHRHLLILNASILLYFAFDSVVALSTNYLINEHLSLVAPIWLMRTVLLQLFYLSLIYFSWQIGKTQEQ